MTISLLIWILVFLEAFLIGQALFLWIDRNHIPGEMPAWSFFIGLAVIAGISSIFSLFAPTGLISNLAIAILATCSFFYLRAIRPSIPWRKMPTPPIILGPLFLAFLFSMAMTLRQVSNPDTNLYHAQTIRWIESFPAIPGLANLHGRFGFNSAWFVLNSLYGFAFLGGRSFHVLNGLVFFIFTANVLAGWQKTSLPISILGFGSIIAGVQYLGSDLSSPGTDSPATLLAWSMMWLILLKQGNFANRDWFALAIISVFAVTIKMSSAFLMISLPVAVLVLLRSGQKSVASKLIMIALLVGLPVLIRNVITTGYLVYPIPSLDLFTVWWKVPLERVVEEQNGILVWGRLPGESISKAILLPISDWLPRWFNNLTLARKALVFFGVALPFIGIPLHLWGRKKFTAGFLGLFWMGSLFWLLSSPDLRFGYSMLIPSIFLSAEPVLQAMIIKIGLNSGLPRVKAIFAIIYFCAILGASNASANILNEPFLQPDYDKVKVQSCQIGNSNIQCAKNYGSCSYHAFPCIPHQRLWVRMVGNVYADGFIGTK